MLALSNILQIDGGLEQIRARSFGWPRLAQRGPSASTLADPVRDRPGYARESLASKLRLANGGAGLLRAFDPASLSNQEPFNARTPFGATRQMVSIHLLNHLQRCR